MKRTGQYLVVLAVQTHVYPTWAGPAIDVLLPAEAVPHFVFRTQPNTQSISCFDGHPRRRRGPNRCQPWRPAEGRVKPPDWFFLGIPVRRTAPDVDREDGNQRADERHMGSAYLEELGESHVCPPNDTGVQRRREAPSAATSDCIAHRGFSTVEMYLRSR